MNTPQSAVDLVPAHVPREVIWDANLDDFVQQFDDPYVEGSEAMHAGPDIVWAARGGYKNRPGWVLTRYRDFQDIHADTEHFSPAPNGDASDMLGFALPLLPFESDPPKHTKIRRLLKPWFEPRQVRKLDGSIRQICAELIGNFSNPDGCEYMAEFAELFPSMVFLDLMGLPKDMLSQFLEWEDQFMRGESVEIRQGATRAIYDYLKQSLEECRSNPRDDLISAIANAQIDGEPISDTDAIGTSMLLYFGGLDTVKSSLGWQMWHVARHPDLQARLRAQPDLIPSAVNELMRAYAVSTTGRTVIKDCTFHGVPMKAGEQVVLATYFASRDPRAYDNPHVIDISRNPRHVSFGTGIHICLGMHLAKLEMKIILEEFLSRFDNIRLPEGDRMEWTSCQGWAVLKLPLIWDAVTQ